MKTKIITLESHDDLISVRDKLSWAKTPRILLVWPKFENVTLRMLDLKVLQRHADSLGAQLGLVTRRANVRRDAESLGIPVFISSASAQKDPWLDTAPRTQRIPKPPRHGLRQMRDSIYEKEPAWRTSLPGRVIIFTAGVLAVLALAGIFVPRAVVTLHPESQNQSVVIPVNASAAFESVSVSGDVPAQTLFVVVDAQESMAVTNGAGEENQAKLRDSTLENLRRSAELQLRAQINADDLLLLDTIEIGKTLLEEFSAPAGQAGKTLMLKMQVEFSARIISNADLKQLSLSTLSASTARGFSPFGDITFKLLANPVTDSSGVTRFELDVQQITLRDIDEVKVFFMIRGKNLKEAQLELMNVFQLRGEPQITIRPAWWQWLPLIPFNISVEVSRAESNRLKVEDQRFSTLNLQPLSFILIL